MTDDFSLFLFFILPLAEKRLIQIITTRVALFKIVHFPVIKCPVNLSANTEYLSRRERTRSFRTSVALYEINYRPFVRSLVRGLTVASKQLRHVASTC